MEELGFDNVNSEKNKIVNLSEAVSLIKNCEEVEHKHEEHGHSHAVDPHFWLSPSSLKPVVEMLSGTLKKEFPVLKDSISNNEKLLLLDLEILDDKLELLTAVSKRKSFMLYHPALGYLSRDYGLIQYEVQENGKEPSAAHLKTLIDIAHEEGIKSVLIQKQFDRSNAETVAREIGGTTLQIDPLGYDLIQNISEIVMNLEIVLNE